jgi:hypothetical protein
MTSFARNLGMVPVPPTPVVPVHPDTTGREFKILVKDGQ